MAKSNISVSGSTALCGMKEIVRYVNLSQVTILKLIREQSFPARKIRGIWASDTKLIGKWWLKQIKGAD